MRFHWILVPIFSLICLASAQAFKITGQLTLFTRVGQTVVRVELRTEGQVTGEKEREFRSILENIADRFQRKPGIPLERTGGEIHIDRYYTLRDADHTDFYQLAGMLEIYPRSDEAIDTIAMHTEELLSERLVLRAHESYVGKKPDLQSIKIDHSKFASLEEFSRRFRTFGDENALVDNINAYCTLNNKALFKVENAKGDLLPIIYGLSGKVVLTEKTTGINWYVIKNLEEADKKIKLKLTGVGKVNVGRRDMILGRDFYYPSHRVIIPNGDYRHMQRLQDAIKFVGLYVCLPEEMDTKQVTRIIEQGMDARKMDLKERCPPIQRM